MIKFPKWKLFSVIGICLLGIILALPNLLNDNQRSKLPSALQSTINLGLELRGGSHLQLEVDLKAVYKDYMTSFLDDVRTQLRKTQIGYSGLTIQTSSGVDSRPMILVTLRDPKDVPNALGILKKIDKSLDVFEGEDNRIHLAFQKEAMEGRNRQIVDQCIEVIRRRVDESGTKEPTILRLGTDRIILQLPGVDDPAVLKQLLGRTAKLTFRAVDLEVGDVEVNANGTARTPLPSGTELLVETRTSERPGQPPVTKTVYHPIKKQVAIGGETLTNAQASFNRNGEPSVSITFNSVGSRKLAEFSGKYLNKPFAIILDNKVLSAPYFRDIIPNGHAEISGSFTTKEANELALLLRAGALPAPLKIIEERTVGPSLGADSIHDGQMATILAFILVACFMLLSYSLFGAIADIALVFNLIILFAALSLLQATLTLPGIAAIALTIGMAVDANVLIYERIKEELRGGARTLIAIESGYKRAMTTIIDSNLTTLIGAAVLFEFGSGPIRGFAVNLALGILISMFTALSLTKLIIAYWYGHKQRQTLPI